MGDKARRRNLWLTYNCSFCELHSINFNAIPADSQRQLNAGKPTQATQSKQPNPGDRSVAKFLKQKRINVCGQISSHFRSDRFLKKKMCLHHLERSSNHSMVTIRNVWRFDSDNSVTSSLFHNFSIWFKLFENSLNQIETCSPKWHFFPFLNSQTVCQHFLLSLLFQRSASDLNLNLDQPPRVPVILDGSHSDPILSLDWS